MSDSNRPRGDRRGVHDVTREQASRAFAVIGNETRLAVLLALWEAYDPWTASNAMTFSELRRAVDYADTGNFSFHLEKLVGPFVRKTDGGYELRRAGLKLVSAVLAGVGTEDLDIPPTPIDKECSFCGAVVEASYEDEVVYIACSECEGFFGEAAGMPPGTLTAAELDPAGIADRTPEEMFYVAWIAAGKALQSAIEGVCSVCSGPVEHSLDVCADHDDEARVCGTCGRGLSAMARFTCTVCKDHQTAPPRTLLTHHPAVVAFYWERGLPVQYHTDDWEGFKERKNQMHHEQDLVSTDPPRVAVTVSYAGDELHLVVDEDLHVVETTLVEGVEDGADDDLKDGRRDLEDDPAA